MSKQLTFSEVIKKHFPILEQYVPIVERVHGGSHPEFYEVRKLFDEINKKVKNSGSEKPELSEEFAKLRAVTDNYTVPGDVCESYEAVYKMLAEADTAYQIK
ncbi:MAG: iron-sulfur cluster repair di-iron protein, ric [Zhaonellaceae bacterium]|jgi:iron-sulfur cluster repair protein YtfE (RIC family)|nr:iron-sulfur cluster repair di-iron protein, ric [Clostridia bacterium]